MVGDEKARRRRRREETGEQRRKNMNEHTRALNMTESPAVQEKVSLFSLF